MMKFKKYGVVLLLIIAISGFSMSSVSAGHHIGSFDLKNIHFDLESKSLNKMNWVYFRLFSQEDYNSCIADAKWKVKESRSNIEARSDLNIVNSHLEKANKTYYADAGVSYYNNEKHRANCNLFTINTDKKYRVIITGDTYGVTWKTGASVQVIEL